MSEIDTVLDVTPGQMVPWAEYDRVRCEAHVAMVKRDAKIDLLCAEVERWQDATGLCCPPEEDGGDPGGVTPAVLERHLATLRARVRELEEVGEAARAFRSLAARSGEWDHPWEEAWIALAAALAKLDAKTTTADRLTETEQQQWDRAHWGGKEP